MEQEKEHIPIKVQRMETDKHHKPLSTARDNDQKSARSSYRYRESDRIEIDEHALLHGGASIPRSSHRTEDSKIGTSLRMESKEYGGDTARASTPSAEIEGIMQTLELSSAQIGNFPECLDPDRLKLKKLDSLIMKGKLMPNTVLHKEIPKLSPLARKVKPPAFSPKKAFGALINQAIASKIRQETRELLESQKAAAPIQFMG